jgi:phosphoribosylformylglycinamidine cyclo-ligase
VLPLLNTGVVKGVAHITGGGFQENIDRILPSNIDAMVETNQWTPEPLFEFLRTQGGVENNEMYRTFNMGIGLVLVTGEADARQVLDSEETKPYEPVVIGRTVAGAGGVRMVFK